MDTIEWTPWESLGHPDGVEIARAVVHRNQDGRLEVFALAGNRLFNVAQTAPNGQFRAEWRDKEQPANVSLTAHVIGRNADGRQEIFAVGSDGGIWQKWQLAPNDGWSDWKGLGAPQVDVAVTPQFTVGRNQDARQELFVVGDDGNVWQIWQIVANGGWSKWRKLGQPPAAVRRADRITIATNLDGRQQLFVIGGDAALWTIAQVAPNVGWGDWTSLAKPRDIGFADHPKERDLSDPVVAPNADGHLEVFAPGNGAFCNRWQESPNSMTWRHEGWNAKPQPAPDVGIVCLDVALNLGGPRTRHLEVFAVADNGELWHAWQVDQAPNWSKWDSLGAPAAKIRGIERLTVGANEDGRLDAFVVGQDGAAWHRSQKR